MGISKDMGEFILWRDGGFCQHCGVDLNSTVVAIDHKTPRSLGGSDDPSNLQALCRDCNSVKGSTIDEGTEFNPPESSVIYYICTDCTRIRQSGRVPRMTNIKRETKNNMVKWFLTKCERVDDHYTVKSVAYNHYLRWCRQQCVEPGAASHLGKVIYSHLKQASTRKSVKINGVTKRVYEGLKVNE